MSKELEALEDIILYLNANEPKGLYCKNIETLKTALKEYEEIKKLKQDVAISYTNKKIMKERIALEIIKNILDIKFIERLDLDYYAVVVRPKIALLVPKNIRRGGNKYEQSVASIR